MGVVEEIAPSRSHITVQAATVRYRLLMVFAKGAQRQSCDVQEASLWYELVITAPNGVSRVERYTERAALLRRQHELFTAWKARGWRELEVDPAAVRSR